MRYLSLFSGIEATSLAWQLLGWTPVAFSEIDPFCCELLRQRFPNVPNLGDVTATDFVDQAKSLGQIDLVVGGSPCQSFSVAGLRGGTLPVPEVK
jgi:DNA (cytosine-5)-methyltransferase 1